ncbi:MAG: hypothetical protein MZV70_68745 [Desulfobacterales bacterium]|nr:hypothetical protein [Desulfobacterales bacterium]
MKKSQLKELVEKLAAAEERMAALERGDISTSGRGGKRRRNPERVSYHGR